MADSRAGPEPEGHHPPVDQREAGEAEQLPIELPQGKSAGDGEERPPPRVGCFGESEWGCFTEAQARKSPTRSPSQWVWIGP